MSDAFKNSLKNGEDPQFHDRSGVVRQEPPVIEGIQHRVSVLRVREGRIIEQSARLSGF
ncbi:MAG: hypothetical protein K0S54_3184 [Alphaproteobacteria bacterium]|jgi:hypothetical protein|nr:hypothetical protein [Alphaproteobacteria bacterium]